MCCGPTGNYSTGKSSSTSGLLSSSVLSRRNDASGSPFPSHPCGILSDESRWSSMPCRLRQESHHIARRCSNGSFLGRILVGKDRPFSTFCRLDGRQCTECSGIHQLNITDRLSDFEAPRRMTIGNPYPVRLDVVVVGMVVPTHANNHLIVFRGRTAQRTSHGDCCQVVKTRMPSVHVGVRAVSLNFCDAANDDMRRMSEILLCMSRVAVDWKICVEVRSEDKPPKWQRCNG